MDVNGQVVTLPGVILTRWDTERKIYVPFDNIDFLAEQEEGTAIFFKRQVGGMDSLTVKESIPNIMSPETAAKFGVDFAGAFMRGMAEKIKLLKKLQGG